MQKITVNTGLKDFVFLDRITYVNNEHIGGIRKYANAPAFYCLESLAQLGAFHSRYLIRFERHAFLLKITRCVMHAKGELTGIYALSGKLTGRSGLAFTHVLKAKKDGKDVIEGEFMFATVDYDRRFKKELLLDHYRNVFSCLRNDSKTD